MLVLTRREGESILLLVDGKTIEVNVSRIQGSHAKISIDAPREVEIVREELSESRADRYC